MASEQTGSTAPASTLSPVKIWGPPCSVGVLIFILSSTPGAYFPEHSDTINNILHLVEFGLLAFLLARAIDHVYNVTKTGLVVWATAICCLFGLLDEAHQFLVPERVFDLMDLLFDSVGAAMGSLGYVLFKARVSSVKNERRASSVESDT